MINMNLLKIIAEEYSNIFDIEHLKTLTSFNSKVKYCEQTLKRINSGSSRIVYLVDEKNVLKLAKNTKGVYQNKKEISFINDQYINYMIAKILDYSEDGMWTIMEKAEKLTVGDFKRIVGVEFKQFSKYIDAFYQHRIKNGPDPNEGFSEEFIEYIWEEEFISGILDLIGGYNAAGGDLSRMSSYGIVNRSDGDEVVLVDYGLDNDGYDSHYK